MELFNDAPGPPKLSAGHFSLWADRRGSPRHQVFPKPTYKRATFLRRAPSCPALRSLMPPRRNTFVTKVVFLLNDGTDHSTLISIDLAIGARKRGHLTNCDIMYECRPESRHDGRRSSKAFRQPLAPFRRRLRNFRAK
jgi:hypothetical protein